MVKSKNDIAFEILVLVIITLVGLACLIPILFVISYSLTPMEEMLRNGGFSLIPRNITFSAYKQMLNDPTLMNAMKVSAFITIVGTAANLVVTLMLAYYRSSIFDAPRRRWMRPAADVLCISIVCSTMLLKQHSCIDAALGALLALALDTAFSRMMDTNDLPQMRRI